MSENKKEKVIHVDNLTIYAKDVEIINESKQEEEIINKQLEGVSTRRDPWGFFWGRPRFGENETELKVSEAEEHGDLEKEE